MKKQYGTLDGSIVNAKCYRKGHSPEMILISCHFGQICDIIFSKILGSEESWGDQN
jgi:hypothetical protein